MVVGGGERSFCYLMLGVDKSRFEPMLCTLGPLGPMGTALKLAGVQCREHLNGPTSFATVQKMFRLMREVHPHVVVLMNTPGIVILGGLAARLARVPSSVTAVHITWEHDHNPRRLCVNRLCHPLFDRAIAVSQGHAKRLAYQEGIPSGKIVTIYNGVDPAVFNGSPNGLGRENILNVPSGAQIIGIVASLRPEKAHSVLLEAIAQLLPRYPNLYLVIIGDGTERTRVERRICDIGIIEHVRMLGSRSDIPFLLPLFDIGVLSSRAEIFSIAVLEYMAASLPVVAPRIPWLWEQVVDGHNGFLFNSGDANALSDRIAYLLSNPATAKSMGHNGRILLEKSFTLKRTIDEFEGLIETLVDSRA